MLRIEARDVGQMLDLWTIRLSVRALNDRESRVFVHQFHRAANETWVDLHVGVHENNEFASRRYECILYGAIDQYVDSWVVSEKIKRGNRFAGADNDEFNIGEQRTSECVDGLDDVVVITQAHDP
jgi:hypothetical protein